jgi:hypothetical protein
MNCEKKHLIWVDLVFSRFTLCAIWRKINIFHTKIFSVLTTEKMPYLFVPYLVPNIRAILSIAIVNSLLAS